MLRKFGLGIVPMLLVFAGGIGAGCKEVEQTGSTATTGPTTQAGAGGGGGGAGKLLIASYEPTVELYKDLNAAFEQQQKEKTGRAVDAETFHGPSGTQAKKIAEGNEVDIAALSVDFDIDKIAEKGRLNKDWRSEYPNDAVPYTSSVIFMVRKGNPKNIKDWEDLARDDVTGLAPDPLTGGGARYIYLSAWAHALRKAKAEGKSAADAEAAARAFTTKVYDKAVLHPAMRQSTTHFLQTGEGDVLFGWENEILQIVNDPRAGADYERVIPSDSIIIECPVAIVDEVVAKRGTGDLAKAYVDFLYSPAGQEIIAKRYNRPSNTEVAAKYNDQFPPLNLFRFKEHFPGWPQVMKTHFDPNSGELAKMRKGS